MGKGCPQCRGKRGGELLVHRSWPETRTKGPKRPNLLSIEDNENQTPAQSAFDAFGLEDAMPTGPTVSCLAATRTCSSARTGQDGQKHARGNQTSKCIGNKIRDSPDPGVVCNIRPRILRLERHVGRQQCGGFGSGQTSPQRMETVVSEFSETTASGSSLQRSGRGDVQDRWYAGRSHPGHVRSQSPTSGNAVTQIFEFLGTDGGWSPKLGDTVIPSHRYREKQNWRGRRYDLSRLKTMFMDGASVREASTTTATRQAIVQPEFRRILVAVPLSGRESAGGDGAKSMTPLWSIRKPANADDGNQPSLCVATRKVDVSTKVGQSSLHWSRHIASTATKSCLQYCFMVTPLPTPPRLFRVL